MKERVKVMQDVYENRSTNKKAAGCTVIISGEMKEVMDKIIAKHPEYKSYAPVSYTHLDVYKRQLYKSVSAIAMFLVWRGEMMQTGTLKKEKIR